MIISYQGGNYFKFQSGETIILVDPENQRSFKGASLVLNTIKPTKTETPEGEMPFWIEHQGEYEIQGVQVLGIAASAEDNVQKTIYKIDFDGLAVGILGYLTKEPEPKIQENLKNLDCLIIPGGGKPFISVNSATKLIRQLEPSIIIPSFSANPKELLKEFSQENGEPEEKLNIKKKDLKEKAMTIKCLR